jgi:hypothetical protein
MRINQGLKRAENVENFVDFEENAIKKRLRIQISF